MLPADGATLADFGIKNGPVGFTLPKGLAISQVIDQPNVVTVIVSAEQAGKLGDYLATNLASMGFTITGRTPTAGTATSLTFEMPDWQGAFTTGDRQAGLTLRRGHATFSSAGGR